MSYIEKCILLTGGLEVSFSIFTCLNAQLLGASLDHYDTSEPKNHLVEFLFGAL